MVRLNIYSPNDDVCGAEASLIPTVKREVFPLRYRREAYFGQGLKKQLAVSKRLGFECHVFGHKSTRPSEL